MKGGGGVSAREGEEDAGLLAETLRSGGDEVERVGAGYELASLVRSSKEQGGEALRSLLSMAQEGSEDARSKLRIVDAGCLCTSRVACDSWACVDRMLCVTAGASMYGLASVGDPAAADVAAALEASVAAGNAANATNLAYALGEAVRSTVVAEGSLQTLQTCMDQLGAELAGNTDPTDDRAKKMQTAVASCIQAMGCIGERVVSTTDGDEELTSRLVTQVRN